MNSLLDLVFFSDLQLLQKNAKKLGIDTYLIAKKFSSVQEIEELRKKIKKTDFDFRLIAVLDSIDFKELNKLNNKVDFIAVQGGSVELNKFAVQRKEINLLLNPVNRFQPSLDTAIARESFERNAPFVFTWSEFNSLNKLQKAFYLKNFLQAKKLIQKFHVNAFFFSGARNEKELINPKKEWKKTVMDLGFEKDFFENSFEGKATEFFVSRKSIPSFAECMNLLDYFKVPKNIIEHSLQVADVAKLIGEKINAKKGKVNAEFNAGKKGKLNLDLIEASALLHDLAKHSTDLNEKTRHHEAGARELERIGLNKIASIVREHGTDEILRENPFTSLESEIVFYADKRVAGSKAVSVEERFNYLFKRYGSIGKEVSSNLKKCFPKVIELEKALSEKAGTDLGKERSFN
ncbi:MAG: HD domain-containing protein [Candidatus Diapherotrites archaeon]